MKDGQERTRMRAKKKKRGSVRMSGGWYTFISPKHKMSHLSLHEAWPSRQEKRKTPEGDVMDFFQENPHIDDLLFYYLVLILIIIVVMNLR
jgi:hypothetical protein